MTLLCQSGFTFFGLSDSYLSDYPYTPVGIPLSPVWISILPHFAYPLNVGQPILSALMVLHSFPLYPDTYGINIFRNSVINIDQRYKKKERKQLSIYTINLRSAKAEICPRKYRQTPVP